MTLQEQLNALRQDNAALRKALSENVNTIASLNATISHLTELIETLQKTNSEQTEIIKALKDEVARLTERIHKNSRNSSKPPSTDGLEKPNPVSLRKKTGKKQGGQEGHNGVHLMAFGEPDHVEPHMPSGCEGCFYFQECMGKACIAESRKVIDVSVEIEVTEHRALEIECPLHRDLRRGTFPENVRGPIQYGEELQALVVSLNTVGALGINRIHEIQGNVFQVPLSTGVISNIVHRCAESVTAVVTNIADKVAGSALSHFDETGLRVDGKLWWVHDASTSKYTYLAISRKRGAKGMNEIGILPRFRGIAIHDCWAPYWKYPDLLFHGICNAHITRELLGVTENHPEQLWATSFKELLEEMKLVRDKAVAKGQEKLSDYYHNKFSRRYDEIITAGLEMNPIQEPVGKKRGRPKRGKIRALIERLQNKKEAVCLFIKNFAVPFTNNQAEQDIRIIKVKSKVSGGFRTDQGARDYLKIMSYVGTAKKNNVNVHEAIRQAIIGDIQWTLACGI